jgi:hypothetical protein
MADKTGVAPGIKVTTSQYDCIGKYAEAIMNSPGLDSVTAYFRNDSGTWKVLDLGTAGMTAQNTGIPVDIFDRLNKDLFGTPPQQSLRTAANSDQSTPPISQNTSPQYVPVPVPVAPQPQSVPSVPTLARQWAGDPEGGAYMNAPSQPINDGGFNYASVNGGADYGAAAQSGLDGNGGYG